MSGTCEAPGKLAAALLATVLFACGEAPTRPEPPIVPTAYVIEGVPARRLDTLPAPPVEAFTVAARGPTEADAASVAKIREITGSFTRQAIGISAVGTAEAFLLPGFFSGSLIAGAVILAPLAIGMDLAVRKQQETITTVLKEEQFITTTQHALDGIASMETANRANQPEVAVIVLAFGLVPKYPAQKTGLLCLVVDAELVVRAGEREVYRDTVYIEPYRRSADAPPPVCAEMSAFADRDGAALRNALRDYAQVLAAIAGTRLKALPWKR